MGIKTRQATPNDTPQLYALAARTFGLACPPGTPPADIEAFVATHLSEASFIRYLADPDRTVLIVTADGEPVGYSMLVGGPIGDADVAALVDETASIELSKFYLSPDLHGSGAAAELMTATLHAATTTGARFCWLGVNQRNVRAAKFYAKHSFEVIGVKRFRVGEHWHNDHVRQRALA